MYVSKLKYLNAIDVIDEKYELPSSTHTGLLKNIGMLKMKIRYKYFGKGSFNGSIYINPLFEYYGYLKCETKPFTGFGITLSQGELKDFEINCTIFDDKKQKLKGKQIIFTLKSSKTIMFSSKIHDWYKPQ